MNFFSHNWQMNVDPWFIWSPEGKNILFLGRWRKKVFFHFSPPFMTKIKWSLPYKLWYPTILLLELASFLPGWGMKNENESKLNDLQTCASSKWHHRATIDIWYEIHMSNLEHPTEVLTCYKITVITYHSVFSPGEGVEGLQGGGYTCAKNIGTNHVITAHITELCSCFVNPFWTQNVRRFSQKINCSNTSEV